MGRDGVLHAHPRGLAARGRSDRDARQGASGRARRERHAAPRAGRSDAGLRRRGAARRRARPRSRPALPHRRDRRGDRPRRSADRAAHAGRRELVDGQPGHRRVRRSRRAWAGACASRSRATATGRWIRAAPWSSSRSQAGHAVIALERLDVAERLYRVTGAGLYRDSVRLGLEVPIRHPLVNAGVAGQDSVQTVLYRGRRLLDLGRHTVARASALELPHDRRDLEAARATAAWIPALGVDLDYFVGPDGNVRAMAAIPGPGATLAHRAGERPRCARRGDALRPLRQTHADRPARRARPRALRPGAAGLPARARARRRHARTAARLGAAWCAARTARSSTTRTTSGFRREPRACATPRAGSPSRRFPRRARRPSAGAGGEVRYAWRPGAPGADEARPSRAPAGARRGALRARARHRERPARRGPRQLDGGESVSGPLRPHLHASWRARPHGSARSGTPKADTPMGPWRFARKIVSHRNYSFYNPFHHVFFDQRGGRTLFFEGTYTAAFAESAVPTPRYDYNQIMHRLDLEDPRLLLPVPIYDLGSARAPRALRRQAGAAPGGRRPGDRLLRARSARAGDRSRVVVGRRLRQAAPGGGRRPRHRAALLRLHLPRIDRAALRTLPLVVGPAGRSGRRPPRTPLAFVFESPLRVRLPVSAYLGRDERRRRPRPLPARGARGRGRAVVARRHRARAARRRRRLELRVVVAGRLGVGEARRGAAPGGPARRAARSHDAGW